MRPCASRKPAEPHRVGRDGVQHRLGLRAAPAAHRGGYVRTGGLEQLVEGPGAQHPRPGRRVPRVAGEPEPPLHVALGEGPGPLRVGGAGGQPIA